MLLRKETREILASRAYWIMLALLGPLVAQAFTTAVSTYAEASRGGLPQAFLACQKRPWQTGISASRSKEANMLAIISDLHINDGTTGQLLPPAAMDLVCERLCDIAWRASWR